MYIKNVLKNTAIFGKAPRFGSRKLILSGTLVGTTRGYNM